MKQFDVPDEMKVAFDYTDENLPFSVKTVKPTLLEYGRSFCAVFGPDPQSAIFGWGDTAKAALLDWNNELYRRSIENKTDDEVARYVMDTIINTELEL